MRTLWEDVSDAAVIRRRGWFSTAALGQIREQSQSGRADYYMLQWAILTLELWAANFSIEIRRSLSDLRATRRYIFDESLSAPRRDLKRRKT